MDIDMYSEIVKCETCGGDCDIIGNRENVCIEYFGWIGYITPRNRGMKRMDKTDEHVAGACVVCGREIVRENYVVSYIEDDATYGYIYCFECWEEEFK